MNNYFGEFVRNGSTVVFVNSAEGNRGFGTVLDALGSRVASDGSVPKSYLLEEVQRVTGETPAMEETIFGAVAVRHYVAARLAAITGHEYTKAGVLKVMKEKDFDFVERTDGLMWGVTRSLDNGVDRYVAMRDPRGGYPREARRLFPVRF